MANKSAFKVPLDADIPRLLRRLQESSNKHYIKLKQLHTNKTKKISEKTITVCYLYGTLTN